MFDDDGDIAINILFGTILVVLLLILPALYSLAVAAVLGGVWVAVVLVVIAWRQWGRR